jgi:hypothetical protein
MFPKKLLSIFSRPSALLLGRRAKKKKKKKKRKATTLVGHILFLSHYPFLGHLLSHLNSSFGRFLSA